jgi:hypothetical protein
MVLAWFALGGVEMVQPISQTIDTLYEADETAWLEQTADLIRSGRLGEIDPLPLAEYLTDMANRDRREVFSRLVILLTHLLKWEYQTDRRSGSWRGTIREQRRELRLLLESGTLRKHAATVLIDAYAEARGQAADETEQDIGAFPVDNPWSLDAALGGEGE